MCVGDNDTCTMCSPAYTSGNRVDFKGVDGVDAAFVFDDSGDPCFRRFFDNIFDNGDGDATAGVDIGNNNDDGAAASDDVVDFDGVFVFVVFVVSVVVFVSGDGMETSVGVRSGLCGHGVVEWSSNNECWRACSPRESNIIQNETENNRKKSSCNASSTRTITRT
jgi:hypothetical protein